MFNLSSEQALENCSKLRVFISIDIIGSTAHKQHSERYESVSWISTFIGFFDDCNQIVQETWAELRKTFKEKGDITLGGNPEFWKSSGDEVIYTHVVPDGLGSETAIAVLLLCKMLAQRLREGWNDRGMDLDAKIAVWCAGFPVNNFEIYSQSGLQDEEDIFANSTLEPEPVAENLLRIAHHRSKGEIPVRDLEFLGPSIDLGFRLRAYANRRELVMSADFALLASVRPINNTRVLSAVEDELGNVPKLHCHTTKVIKGINSAENYPIIWADIETESGRQSLAESLDTIRNQESNETQILDFVQKFLDNSAPIRTVPYTDNARDAEMPEWHVAARAKLLATFETLIKGLNEKKVEGSEPLIKD